MEAQEIWENINIKLTIKTIKNKFIPKEIGLNNKGLIITKEKKKDNKL